MTSQQEIIDYWFKSSQEDFKTATSLLETGRHHHALFFCHLSLEKYLKALIVKNTQSPAPPIHHLPKLTKLAQLTPTQDQTTQLTEINKFNLESRYDDYKFSFYQKATSKFTQKWFKITQELLSWLKTQ